MENVVWSVKISSDLPSVGLVVRSFTVIEQRRSTRKEFEIYLINQFGKERVVEFNRVTGER